MRGFKLAGGLLVAAVITVATQAVAHRDVLGDIAVLDTKLDADPDRADWLVERAALHHLAGDYGAALADLNEAYELTPELPSIALQRALVLAALDYDAAALNDVELYLATRPRDKMDEDLRDALLLKRALLSLDRDGPRRGPEVVDAVMRTGSLDEELDDDEVPDLAAAREQLSQARTRD